MGKIFIDNLSYSYFKNEKNQVVKDLTCTFESSDISLILGRSGCGKSTLLYLLAGIYPENSGYLNRGKILINDENITELTPNKRVNLVAMMFQNPDLQFCMDTVKNEIIFSLENKGTPVEEIDALVDEALNFCDISHLRDRQLVTLSGGEKQKAMLACIVALNPKWILLDEPFANIDIETAKLLIEKIKKLHDERGLGVVAIDHNPDLWKEISPKLFSMEEGKVTDFVGVPREHNYISMEPRGEAEEILTVENMEIKLGKNFYQGEYNYTFQKNRIYAIMGRSGCGKSTFLNGLGGIYKYKGSVKLNGMELSKIPKRKMVSKVGMVFQNPQDQFVADTVYKEIAVSFKKEETEVAKKKTEEILRRIDLWKYRLFSPFMLSQGQQRRLGVAALLASNADVIICDEPTYAQDYDNTVAIMDMLRDYTIENGITLIYTTHDDKLAWAYSDKVLRMEGGDLNEIS